MSAPSSQTRSGRRRPGRSGLALAAAAALASGAAAPAAADPGATAPGGPHHQDPPVELPAPTGKLPVGSTGLHLVDHGRSDIWNPEAAARELMLTVWYPAASHAGDRADYVTPEESARAIEAVGVDLPADALHEVGTHSIADAQVRRPHSPGGYPLVLLSPGAGHSRSRLTSIAEDLAGHGYVAVGIDHAYEAAEAEFPGGRILQCRACGQDRWAEGTRNRAADASFVLDELTGQDPAWPGARHIDAEHIGMAGHSAGGSAAAEVLRTDDRVDAALNFDGPYYEPAVTEGVADPLGLVTSDLQPEPPFHASQERMWPQLRGWRQWLRLSGSGHSSVTDWGVLIDRFGIRDQVPEQTLTRQYGTLPTERGLAVARDYTTAFFTHHLRGHQRPEITDPHAAHPELAVVADGRG
ncbi:lipase [Streptomonospora sediminis]